MSDDLIRQGGAIVCGPVRIDARGWECRRDSVMRDGEEIGYIRSSIGTFGTPVSVTYCGPLAVNGYQAEWVLMMADFVAELDQELPVRESTSCESFA